MIEIKTTSVETLPIWTPILKEPFAQKEIAFMKRHYDNVESIISATKKVNWDALPVYAYGYDVGFLEKVSAEFWDEDEQRMRFYSNFGRPYEGSSGLIQNAFEAAERQSHRTGEHIFSHHPQRSEMTPQHLEMTPPCDLSIDTPGSSCRLLWGLTAFDDYCGIKTYRFDFVTNDHQFMVNARRHYHQLGYYQEGSGTVEYLQVVLFRGEPFDSPYWGTQLQTKLVEVPDQAENRTGAKGQG